MELCWDNIENIRLSNKGNFRDIVKKRTFYLKVCKQCEIKFLGEYKTSTYCCKSCSNRDRTISNETKQKISKSVKQNIEDKRKNFKLVDKSEKYIKKSLNKLNSSNGNWKGGYDKTVALYNTYATQLEWCEEVRRNEQDPNMLEVKCFKCNEWYIPIRSQISNRLQYLKGNYRDEGRFYCSQECKDTCSIYHKSINTIMKEDAVRAGRLPWLELKREIQPELRQMVLERDNNECVKCGKTSDLQCHHIFPVNIEPLLSTDIDNCITLCVDCHKEAHTKDGCRYNQLHIEEC